MATKTMAEKKESLLDVLLFLLLTFLVPLSAFFSFSLVKGPDGTGIFGYGIVEGKLASLPFALAVFLLYLLVFVLLLVRRFSSVKKKSLVLLTVLAAFLLLRLAGILSFPRGEQTFSFPGLRDSTPISFAFDVTRRSLLYSALKETMFLSYLYFVFQYFDGYGKKMKIALKGIQFLYGAVVLAALVFSFVREWKGWEENFRFFFLNGESYCPGIQSFTSNRNVFGFLLFIAFLSLLASFFQRPRVPVLVLLLGITFLELLLVSKTPLLLSLLALFFLFVLFPALHAKEHPAYSAFFLILLVGASAYLLLNLFFPNLSQRRGLLQSLKETVNQFNTVSSRARLWIRALNMMTGPKEWVFGYPSLVFSRLFFQYGVETGEEPIAMAHNIYLKTLGTEGTIGLILFLLSYLLLAVRLFRSLVQGRKEASGYLLLEVLFLFYGFFECRGLFLDQGDQVIFLLLFYLPVRIYLKDSEKERPLYLLTRRLIPSSGTKSC